MKDKFLVYLAGPITGCSYKDCTDWRKYVAQRLPDNFIGVSPLRAKHYLNEERRISDHYPESVLSCTKGITARDKFDVYRCDLLFINFEGSVQVSIGTVMEIAWANVWNKPIVVVMNDKNIHYHSMVRESVGFIVEHLDEAIDVTCAILTPGI